MSAPFRLRADGIDLFIRLTPKSSVDRLEGAEVSADGRSHLKARVRAVPENGAANAALEPLVAKALGVPASVVSVVAGGTAIGLGEIAVSDRVFLVARWNRWWPRRWAFRHRSCRSLQAARRG
ncbi:hypothetical protein X761_17735 [Mesorhizobium sp. LSHC424B00]|nr:DUF167 family protein [Mesorhizobium sp. LSHC424B00]ESX53955.1 hypothetical protein X761_17735 [Mesorhizobium sp. LSHC424B00]